MKTNRRELIIIISILVIALLGYILFTMFLKTSSGGNAVVQHWYQGDDKFNITEDLVEIDFNKSKVTKLKTQEGVPSDYPSYPIIDEKLSTITVLGEHVDPKTNRRAELVIEYNYTNKTVQIIKEVSPKNICSNMGKSTRLPLICIPNQMKVIFLAKMDPGIDDEH